MRYIEEFGKDYAVDEEGNVYSLKNDLILKTRLDRYGYKLVTLHYKGKAFTRKVHRLVAQAYIDNPENLATVNHKDGIKTNNKVNNLEWMSAPNNMKHGFKTGLHTIGEKRKAGRKVKLTNKDVIEIKKMIQEGRGNTEIGKFFGVSCGCIYSIRVGKSWKHISIPDGE
jgi:hypothetical protein